MSGNDPKTKAGISGQQKLQGRKQGKGNIKGDRVATQSSSAETAAVSQTHLYAGYEYESPQVLHPDRAFIRIAGRSFIRDLLLSLESFTPQKDQSQVMALVLPCQ